MKKRTSLVVVALIAGLLTLFLLLTGFESNKPVSSPASNDEKTLIESSEWTEQDGDEVLIYRSETYQYD